MTVAENLDAFWISKLGSDRLAELPGAEGPTVLDKALGVVRKLGKDRDQFYDLLYEGFDGYFHQSVYARTLDKKSMAGRLAALSIGDSDNQAEWWSRQSSGSNRVRVLVGVRKEIQFLADSDQVIRQTIAIPAMVEAFPSNLRLRIMTVQSTADTWRELLGRPINRILTPVVDTELSDLLYNAISPDLAQLGEMTDLSAKAVELMKKTDNVHTYSGTFGVRKVGRTRHTTEGGRLGKRRPLHVVMKPEFAELVSSDEIRHCEIAIQAEHKGLIPGTALVFYPKEGKIVFRRMLGGGVIDDFLAYLAR
jgi:hypothetical protein